MNIEEAARDVKLAELQILSQSIEEKNRRIFELEKKVELLEGMLTRAASLGNGFNGFPQPQPQALPSFRTNTPRRWSVK